MAQRTVTHFKVSAQLFNDITAVLFNLPAITSRDLLNRIDAKDGSECEPIFKIDLKPVRKQKPEKRRVRKPPARRKTARKKVAKRNRRS